MTGPSKSIQTCFWLLFFRLPSSLPLILVAFFICILWFCKTTCFYSLNIYIRGAGSQACRIHMRKASVHDAEGGPWIHELEGTANYTDHPYEVYGGTHLL